MHWVGFTWKDDGEDLVGNMMFDASLGTTTRKSYCAIRDWWGLIRFRLRPRHGIRQHVVYADYEGGRDLKAQYVATQEGDAEKAALVNGHLVGGGGCAKDVEDYLNET